MSAFSVCVSCLAIMLSSHLSRPVQVPVRSAYIIDRRATPSVLAVQTVPVEEHEVRGQSPFGGLVDAKEALDRRAGSDLRARVELSDPHRSRGRVDRSSCADSLRRRTANRRLAGGLAPTRLRLLLPRVLPGRGAGFGHGF